MPQNFHTVLTFLDCLPCLGDFPNIIHYIGQSLTGLRTIFILTRLLVCIGQDRQEWCRISERGSSVSSTAQESRFYCDGCRTVLVDPMRNTDTVIAVLDHVVWQAI